MYKFYLKSNPEQEADLMAYFAAKGWSDPLNMLYPQINAEINGTAPFFYLNFDGTNYTLVDGFRSAFGIIPNALTLDDDYPTGNYFYVGTLTGTNGATLKVNVTLKVSPR
jgi:hypothetical protein